MRQHTSLSESNGALGTLLVEDSRGKENTAVQHTANEVANSVQPRTIEGRETASLLSSSVLQQASTLYETAESSTSSINGPPSSVPDCTRAASMADAPRQQGNTPTDWTPAQLSNPDHLIASCTATHERYEGLPDEAKLHIGSFAAMNAASSSPGGSPLAPSVADAGSMCSAKAGTSDRSRPVPPHLPESRHSKGLQQLWNSTPHTPLMVPSPCSMTGKQSKQGRRHSEEQGHQLVLSSETSTTAEGASQSSSMSGSAVSEVTEGATAHSAVLWSMPMGGADSPHG